MYLSRIDIFGFKSFANKTSLEFEKPDGKSRGITAIVGPNGSGKSNIADALRWVLGEQSLKMIRSKKSEDVLFTGSKRKSKSNASIVSIYLDNSDKSLPIDYNPVIITRKLYRSGESEYLINNNRTRLLDIYELLAKGGVGQRSYCIVSQGMADAVLNATCQERRNILEEASGVKPFELKKQQSQRKIQRAQRNLVRVSDLLKEIKPRLNSLSRQAAKASKKQEIQEKLITRQKAWYSFSLSKNLSSQKDLSEKIKKLEGEILQKDKETQDLEKGIKKTNESLKNFSEEKSSLDQQIYSLQSKRNSLNQQLTILHSKIQISSPDKKTNLAELTTKSQEIDIKIQENIDLSEKIDSQLKLLNQRKETQEKNITKVNEKLQESQQDISRLQAQISKNISTDEIKVFLENIYLLQNNLIEAISKTQSIDEIKNLSGNARKILEKIKKLLSNVSGTYEAKSQDEINNLQKELNTLFEEKENLNLELNKINIEKAGLDSEKKSYDIQIKRLEEEKNDLQKEIDSFKQSASKTTTSTLKEKEEEVAAELKEIQDEISHLKKGVLALDEEEYSNKQTFFDLEKNYHKAQGSLNLLRQEKQEVLIQKTKIDTICESLEAEIRQVLGSVFLNSLKENKNPKEPINETQVQDEISKLKHQLYQIGEIDPMVKDEYEDTKKRFEYLTSQSKDLNETIESINKIIKELDNKIEDLFKNSFKKINEAFDKYFKILFNGGVAKLELVEISQTKKDEDDDEEELKTTLGVEIKAVPPGKKIKNLSMLSGGERSLASLALLFAIISQNPPPFSILDEVEASLDEANSYRFSKILSELSPKTQFIIITHNRETMRQANTIFGVTMQEDGVSQLLSIKIEELEKITKPTS